MLRAPMESMSTTSDGPPRLTALGWRPDLSMITRMPWKEDLSPTLMCTPPMMALTSPTTEPTMVRLARESTDKSPRILMERPS